MKTHTFSACILLPLMVVMSGNSKANAFKSIPDARSRPPKQVHPNRSSSFIPCVFSFHFSSVIQTSGASHQMFRFLVLKSTSLVLPSFFACLYLSRKYGIMILSDRTGSAMFGLDKIHFVSSSHWLGSSKEKIRANKLSSTFLPSRTSIQIRRRLKQ